MKKSKQLYNKGETDGVEKRIFRIHIRTIIGVRGNNVQSDDGGVHYYYKGRIAGGIYDDRLLIKPVKSAIDYVSDIRYEVPYEGAKEMILIEEVDNKEYLTELFKAIYDDLPTPKRKK